MLLKIAVKDLRSRPDEFDAGAHLVVLFRPYFGRRRARDGQPFQQVAADDRLMTLAEFLRKILDTLVMLCFYSVIGFRSFAMNMAEQVPQTSRRRPIQPPNEDESLAASASSMPVTSEKATKTDCAQLYPCVKSETALSA